MSEQNQNQQSNQADIYSLRKQKESEQSQHLTAPTQPSAVTPNQIPAQDQSFTAGYQQGYQAGHTAGFEAGIKYAKILDERTQHLLQQPNQQQAPEQQSQQQPAENSSSVSTAATWAGLAQFISTEDYQEFSKIALTNQQAHELVALSATSLKSSTTARILHLFLGGFGAGYVYLDKGDRAIFHSVVTIALIMYGVQVFNNLDVDYSYGITARSQYDLNLLLMFNAFWGLVLLFELFTLGESTRDTNGQIIRDWLKKANLLTDTKASDS